MQVNIDFVFQCYVNNFIVIIINKETGVKREFNSEEIKQLSSLLIFKLCSINIMHKKVIFSTSFPDPDTNYNI